MSKESNQERLTRLKSIVLSMPEKAGSYQFYDENGVIIYVGKAKKLKSRVSSYFHKEVDRFKTKVLVSKIHNISYTVVNSEEDALLLENSLIKKYNPRYNVLLKDGKTYPSICVSNDYLPRIFKTRQINKRYGTFYGPYTNVSVLKSLLHLISKIYKPRSCRMSITPEGIAQNKYKACLEYHIHNCLGPCISKQSYDDYQANIAQAKQILRGNMREAMEELHRMMLQQAEELNFEAAEELKKRYILLDSFVSKSEVVSHTIRNIDVFSITEDEVKQVAFINYIHVKNGTINQSFTYEYKKKVNESNEDLLASAILEIRNRFGSVAPEIVVPFEINWHLKDAVFIIPQRGDKKKLLELSEMNGKQYLFDRLKQAEKLNPEQKQTRIMKELQMKLQLSKLPYHIECFDNSNISGVHAVAACVVFKGMKPSKTDYRKYNITSVDGPDDYASMKEVVFRRYSRLVAEQKPLPDLIICDGGKGQMGVVREVIEEQLKLSIPIAGLAKNDKHRTNELLFGHPIQTIALSSTSELFFALTRIQDEVHRFAISFHRDKRSKVALQSELDDIKGLGPKGKEKLLQSLHTLKAIKTAPLTTLVDVLGKAKGTLVFNHFQKQKQDF